MISNLTQSSVLGGNLFAYCENNAVNDSDPSGQRRKQRIPPEEYDSKKAINYAKKWYNSINPEFKYNNPYGDCTNFVSQCLNAGGLRENFEWYYSRIWFFGWKKIKVSHAWGNANGLYDYVQKKTSRFCDKKILKNNSDLKKAIDSKKYKKGCAVAFFLTSTGRVWHSVFIGTSTKDNIFYWAHTNSRNGENTKSGCGLAQVIKDGSNVAIFRIKEGTLK